MNDIPEGYYRDENSGMLKMIEQNSIKTETALTASELSRLDAMTPDELKTLVRRLLCQCGAVALMTEEETAQAILDRCANEAVKGSNWLPAAREWFDRKKGKAAQSIAMTVEDKGIGKLSDDRLLVLERELARITGQEAIILPPVPVKLGGG